MQMDKIEIEPLKRAYEGNTDQADSCSFRRRAIGRTNDFLIFSMSAHRSPREEIRWAIIRNVKLFGPTSPRSSSSHEQGAETGAPGFARTVYAAANVAL